MVVMAGSPHARIRWRGAIMAVGAAVITRRVAVTAGKAYCWTEQENERKGNLFFHDDTPLNDFIREWSVVQAVDE